MEIAPGSSSGSQPPDPPRSDLGRSVCNMMKSTFMPTVLSELGLDVESRPHLPSRWTTHTTTTYSAKSTRTILYEEMTKHRAEVCKLIQTVSPSQEAALDDHLIDVLAKVVFGSNMIENAGADWDVTLKLCQAVFRGDDIPDDFGETDPDYVAIKQDLVRKHIPAGTQSVLKSRPRGYPACEAASHIINEALPPWQGPY